MGIKGELAIWEAESFGVEQVNITLGDLLDRRAGEIPDKEALVYNYPELGLNLRLTYRQYAAEVDRLARGLLALEIKPGEHVAVWAPNLPEWILLEMALAKIGAVLLTVTTAYKSAELEYVLRQGDVTHLFMAGEHRGNSYLDSIYSIAPELGEVVDPVRDELSSAALRHLKRVILITPGSASPACSTILPASPATATGHPDAPGQRGTVLGAVATGSPDVSGLLRYEQILALADAVSYDALRARQSSLSPDDVCQMQYTSGTTGFPKGVMLTHNNLLNQAHFACHRSDLWPDERYVTAMPFFHVAGCLGGVLYSLYVGCTLIPMIGFDAGRMLELFALERGTFSFCVPTMLIAMLNHPRFLAGEFDLPSLRYITTGATPVPVVLMEEVKAKLGADCSVVYGMTETSGAVTSSFPTDSFELKAATVGFPQPHTEIKIVNPATGEIVRLDESGELLTRGCLNMKGYYNMPEMTAQTIDADGWLHTGDLATMGANGYFKVVGRTKDMIIRGGENLYPAEIEAFLMRHPKIAEAQVVGVPDPYMGEEAAAVLRLKAGSTADEDEIREYCRSHISRHKIPRYIRFVESYPLTSSGKVKKFELRELLVKELGLEEARKS